MGKVFVEPLNEDSHLNDVFISYASEDRQRVKNILLSNLSSRGVPYFLAGEDIDPGAQWIEVIKDATNNASCGIIVLSSNSMDSEWVWYETGMLEAFGKPIIPFSLESVSADEVPEFLSQTQITSDFEELHDSIQDNIFRYNNLFDNSELNQQVIDDTRHTNITINIDFSGYSDNLINRIGFGMILVRFGNPDAINDSAEKISGIQQRILTTIEPENVVFDQKNTLKIEFVVPVHQAYGIQFKPFVKADRNSDIESVKSLIEDNGFLRPQQASTSTERKRVYFLLPLGNPDGGYESLSDITTSGNIVRDIEGHYNNYIFPQ